MESGSSSSTLNCLQVNTDQENPSLEPSSLTLSSHEGKSADSKTLATKESDSNITQPNGEELPKVNTKSINSNEDIERINDKSDSTITQLNEEELLKMTTESIKLKDDEATDVEQEPTKSDSAVNQLKEEESTKITTESINSKKDEAISEKQEPDKSDSSITQLNEEELTKMTTESTISKEDEAIGEKQQPGKLDSAVTQLNEEELSKIATESTKSKKDEATEVEQNHDNADYGINQGNEGELSEMKVESTNSKEDKTTHTVQEPDNKSETDFQLSTLGEKGPDSIVELESSSEIKKTSSNSSKLNTTEVLAVDVNKEVRDNNDLVDSLHNDVSQITKTEFSSLEVGNKILPISSKDVGMAVDVKQDTEKDNGLNSLLNAEESPNMEVGATGLEENSNISDTQETKSGFDSTDSTNDVDSFITQNAVQIAIKLIDDEEEKGNNKGDSSSSGTILSLNVVENAQHKDSSVQVESTSSKIEGISKKKGMDDERHSDVDEKVTILKDKAEVGIKIVEKGSLDSALMEIETDGSLHLQEDTNNLESVAINVKKTTISHESTEDDKSSTMETEEESCLNLLENTTKLEEHDETKSGSIECLEENNSELDSSMEVQSVDQENRKNESIKTSKESENLSCATQKDTAANPEDAGLSGPKSSDNLQNSNQDFQEGSNIFNVQINEKEVIRVTDSKLTMEVDEQVQREKESVIPAQSSLSDENSKESFTNSDSSLIKEDNSDNKDETSGVTTMVCKSPETPNDTNLESETPSLVDLEQSDHEDTPSKDLLLAFMRSALAKNMEFRKSLSEENEEIKEETVEECGIELICLDDDDCVQMNRPPEAKLCVNPSCMSGADLKKPALFVLTYFKLKKAKHQLVCAECFNFVSEHQKVI